MREKNAEIKIRLTKADKDKIISRAEKAQMNISEFVLTAINKKRIVVANELSKLIADVYGAAVNINQIAKIANTQKFVNKQLVNELFSESDILKKKIDEIINCIVAEDVDCEDISFEKIYDLLKVIIKRLDVLTGDETDGSL